MRVSFLAPARAELRMAKRFDDSEQAGLGKELADEVFAAIARISERPFAWPLVDSEIRRITTHRFPYSILFRPDDKQILIISVIHMHRHPENWIRRIQELG